VTLRRMTKDILRADLFDDVELSDST
jgi:hypothetical protein